MSFAIDPPLLVASGAAIERFAPDDRIAAGLKTAAIATFVGVSLALYANHPATDPIRRSFGSRSGREFMLTSGLARIDESRMTARGHALAISQFALYPLWLKLGAAAVRRRPPQAR